MRRDDGVLEWQWHQRDHMQTVCSTSLQTDNHASTPPLCFYRPDALPDAQPTAPKHWSLTVMMVIHRWWWLFTASAESDIQTAPTSVVSSSVILLWSGTTSGSFSACEVTLIDGLVNRRAPDLLPQMPNHISHLQRLWSDDLMALYKPVCY